MAYSFKGGIRPDDHKYTKDAPIEKIKAPEIVSISLSQHIGVMCKPTVQVGDTVLVGQLIGDVQGGLGCPVHASVSGTVVKIEEVTTQSGGLSYNVVIKNDHRNAMCENIHPFGKKLSEAKFEEILAVLKRAGIAGMGGTAFPTYAKVGAARGKASKLIVNCCEGEPFVTVTRRMIIERLDTIIGGIKILMVALGIREAYIAIERDKKEEIKILSAAVDNNLIKLLKVSPKYPSGSEKHLVYALTKKEVPEGKTPLELGCIVFSAETCSAVFEAFSKGTPLIRRVVTVDGDCVAEPKNLELPIGTPASYVLDQCGGLIGNPKKLIFGGPMMGHTQWDPNAPVSKSTSAILVFSDYFDRESKLEPVCIKCGRCVNACPMKLLPLNIATAVEKGRLDKTESMGAASCIECGACTYSCPGGLQVAQLVGRAKADIIQRRRIAAAGSAKKNDK